MNQRPIPSTREALPVIGCGTYIGFDDAPGSAEYQRLPGVLDALFAAGGKLLDSSPMYGRAEATTGELLEAAMRRSDAFIATKVWTQGREAGIRQMETSMRLLRTERIDLMQIHNLVDWRTHLLTLRRWKEAGRVRCIDCASWAQVLLKFVLSHPAVTCTIPGTSRPEHMADNAAAGAGTTSEPAFWHDKLASIGV